MAQEILLTVQGLHDLQEELDNLRSVGRREAAEKIKVALSFGDLSENSEYDEAKSEQGKLEARIAEIEVMLQHAKILDEDVSTETVHVGSLVTIKCTAKGSRELKFQITGFAQADPAEGRISDESPVGKALLGKKVGDKAVVETPKGTTTYKITEISSVASK